jgi:hypothetical protein
MMFLLVFKLKKIRRKIFLMTLKLFLIVRPADDDSVATFFYICGCGIVEYKKRKKIVS